MGQQLARFVSPDWNLLLSVLSRFIVLGNISTYLRLVYFKTDGVNVNTDIEDLDSDLSLNNCCGCENSMNSLSLH